MNKLFYKDLPGYTIGRICIWELVAIIIAALIAKLMLDKWGNLKVERIDNELKLTMNPKYGLYFSTYFLIAIIVGIWQFWLSIFDDPSDRCLVAMAFIIVTYNKEKMKKAITTIIILLIGIQINAQLEDKCLPKKLIVAAENLNFRSEPNTNSEPIGKLTNSELLTFIEIKRMKQGNYWSDYANSWIKVKRDLTGEAGYVLGKYVKSQEMAYMNYHDAESLQSGNWYGIYQEGDKVKIEKANPKIEELNAEFKSILSNDKHKILICSQDEIKEGQINGKLFQNQREYLKIGIQKRLIRIKDFEFSLVCTGEVSYDRGWMKRENEKVIFEITEIDGSRRNYEQQDLSDCILQFGEVGYMIHFAGDLNNDGIPEIIISEATTHGGTVYYFQSQNGKLELQSISGSSSKC